MKEIPGLFMGSLDFSSINKIALDFADHIEANFEEIKDVLLEYESFEVVKDEYERTLDLFRSLHENKEYFVLRISDVAAFLPRNQPLYAFSCFVVVPSLMSQKVHFRIPHCTRSFFPKLLQILKFDEFFPNIVVSKKERLDFLKERTALLVNPLTRENLPATSAVIFTGTSHHAEKLRSIFDSRTLFITNGSGHNPLVVAANADIAKAVEATLKLQLYNQGQDCAAPNSILVHQDVYEEFLSLLRVELAKVKIGPYRDVSCVAGPISEPNDLVRIQALLVENRDWVDSATGGIIRTAEAIVEPTIICKPLKEGGNFAEVFAPIVFLQKYEQDSDLSSYFENQHYSRNAMYVTLYGDSKYVKSLVGKTINGKILHREDTFLHNIHLHERGIERGTQPYGGYGYGASNVSLNGEVVPQPTCPQRDIFKYLVKPIIDSGKVKESQEKLIKMDHVETKNIPKLMGLKLRSVDEPTSPHFGKTYLDSSGVDNTKSRYVELSPKQLFSLLEYPNAEVISRLQQEDREQVQALRMFLMEQKEIKLDDFVTHLYSIPKKKEFSMGENGERQLKFFRNLYQLLFDKDSGPRLPQFILDADRHKICELLDV